MVVKFRVKNKDAKDAEIKGVNRQLLRGLPVWNANGSYQDPQNERINISDP